MKKTLTDSWLKATQAKPTGKRWTVTDTATTGLAAHVSASGEISFYVTGRVRVKGQRRVIRRRLGLYPVVSLKDARTATPAILEMIARGEHPKEVEEKKRADTFLALADRFFKFQAKRGLRHAATQERCLRRELLDEKRKDNWRDKPIIEIRRKDVIAVVERKAAQVTRHAPSGALREAGKLFSHLRATFNYAVKRDLLAHNPCSGVDEKALGAAKVKRTRVLSDAELRWVWQASFKVGHPYGPLVRALMLTGQRLLEIGDANWREIDQKAATLTVPAARMKGNIEHVVPLTPKVLSLLELLPRFKDGHYVFSFTGERSFNNYAKHKKRLDKVVEELAAKEGVAEVPRWQTHDLRRTVRTRLSGLKVSREVAEAILAHVQPGIEGVYNRYSYADEKRAALCAWERALLTIVEPESAHSNVVPLQNKVA